MPTTEVIVVLRIPGFHRWPNAFAVNPDVAYLQDRHRHLFTFKVAWPVTHDDRDVEFHTAQGWVRDCYNEVHDFGPRSCEMIAKELHYMLTEGGRPSPSWIEVWEDDECGSRVTFS